MLSPQNLAVKGLRSARARSLNPPADARCYRRTSLRGLDRDVRTRSRCHALSDGQRHLACWLTLQYLWGHEC
jgi:hypothetical protein